ncbi:MAG: NPCBM/NEW2 domain-containing protein [Thermoguttaceae bacterium]
MSHARARVSDNGTVPFAAVNFLGVFAPLREIRSFRGFAVALLFWAATVQAESPWAVPIRGEPFRADVLAVDANWQVTLAIGRERKVMPAADLVKWGRCAEQGRGGSVVLADGSLLAADLAMADERQVAVDSDSLGTLKIPLEALAGVIFRPPTDPQRRDALVDRLALAKEDADQLLLENGDTLSGLLKGVADEIVQIKTAAGPIEVKTDRILAIVFNPSLRTIKPRTTVAPNAAAPGAAAGRGSVEAWVGLADGSRLLATRLVVEGDRMTLTAAAQTWKASTKSLVFVQPLGGRAVYLSDLKPVEYRQTPLLDLPWPYRADRNVTGGRLRVAGRLYLKGLGVHSAARLVYELDGARGEGRETRGQAGGRPNVRVTGRFAALVAIDDSTAGRGSVRFRVLVDGRERFASPVLRGGDRPVPVSVDLAGAKRLELVVDYADQGDVLDHADWLDARITRD